MSAVSVMAVAERSEGKDTKKKRQRAEEEFQVKKRSVS